MQNICGYEARLLAADVLFYTVLRIPAAAKARFVEDRESSSV